MTTLVSRHSSPEVDCGRFSQMRRRSGFWWLKTSQKRSCALPALTWLYRSLADTPKISSSCTKDLPSQLSRPALLDPRTFLRCEKRAVFSMYALIPELSYVQQSPFLGHNPKFSLVPNTVTHRRRFIPEYQNSCLRLRYAQYLSPMNS